MGRLSPARHDEHKLFVGGISHKFRDTDLKQGTHIHSFLQVLLALLYGHLTLHSSLQHFFSLGLSEPQ